MPSVTRSAVLCISSRDCSHVDGDRVHFSGTMVRDTLKNGLSPETYLFRKDVYEDVIAYIPEDLDFVRDAIPDKKCSTQGP